MAKKKSYIKKRARRKLLGDVPAASTPQYVMVGNTGDNSVKWKVIGSIAGVILLSGAIYVGRKWYLNRAKDQLVRGALDDGSASNFAARLIKTMSGWFTTDKEEIFQVFREIKTYSTYLKVMEAYHSENSGNELDRDLRKNLSKDDYNTVMILLSRKPDYPNKKKLGR